MSEKIWSKKGSSGTTYFHLKQADRENLEKYKKDFDRDKIQTLESFKDKVNWIRRSIILDHIDRIYLKTDEKEIDRDLTPVTIWNLTEDVILELFDILYFPDRIFQHEFTESWNDPIWLGKNTIRLLILTDDMARRWGQDPIELLKDPVQRFAVNLGVYLAAAIALKDKGEWIIP